MAGGCLDYVFFLSLGQHIAILAHIDKKCKCFIAVRELSKNHCFSPLFSLSGFRWFAADSRAFPGHAPEYERETFPFIEADEIGGSKPEQKGLAKRS